MYKNERLELRLTTREVEMLDRVRGPSSRSAWIRNQILRAAQAQYVIPTIPAGSASSDDPAHGYSPE